MSENEEEVIIDFLDMYPLLISQTEYEQLVAKIDGKETLSDGDYNLIKSIIHNSIFWKERYRMLQRKITELSDTLDVIADEY